MIRAVLNIITAVALTLLAMVYPVVLAHLELMMPRSSNFFAAPLWEQGIGLAVLLAVGAWLAFAAVLQWRDVYDWLMRERFPEDVPF